MKNKMAMIAISDVSLGKTSRNNDLVSDGLSAIDMWSASDARIRFAMRLPPGNQLLVSAQHLLRLQAARVMQGVEQP
jgi:hypothetical protein